MKFYTLPKLLTLLFVSQLSVGFSNIKTNPYTIEIQEDSLIEFNGYFNFKYLPEKDQIHLEIAELDKEFLYVNSLSKGIGNNDIGLDRGQLGNERIVYFKRAGNKILMIQPNYKYRSTSSNALEKRSIEEAFAKSVLFGFPIAAEKDGVITIDLTPFLMQDAHGVSQRLERAKQGNYRVDTSRSAISLDRTRAFPQNVEFDVMLTFTGQAKGRLIQSVTPTPDAVTVHQHHSFVALPDDNYTPRRFDPRSGGIGFRFYDYTTPVSESTLQEYIIRHRLEKKDPTAALSEAVEPIVYYLDNGTPEPVRSALLEGGRWWNQAFEAAGYKDAFQVKILPADADPLDVRYNVIQWVHRSTRGWSYGASVVDPRTGEIIKGHVSLGSLRIRQDYMIALGLTQDPFMGEAQQNEAALQMALARIRQLSAHEIGHTLGFAHNFAASAKNRASVMDYPHPTLSLENDQISYANAYDTGIGDWDKISVAYSYSDFPQGVDENQALTNLLENSARDGFRFISDSDARPLGGAHPIAHLWDNGADPTTELELLMRIRKKALNNLSLAHLRTNETYTQLEDRMVPLYLLHRYQVEAVVKLIGGVDYDYAVKGGISYTTKAVPAQQQKHAVQALINTLQPDALMLPQSLLEILPPRAFGSPRSRESFQSQTGVTFDPFALAHTTSHAILGMMFHPERATRLQQQAYLDGRQWSLAATIDQLTTTFFMDNSKKGYAAGLQEVVQANLIEHLMLLGQTAEVPSSVRATVFDKLRNLKTSLSKNKQLAQAPYFAQRINQYLSNYQLQESPEVPKIPDGSPIGSIACDFETVWK
jgi:hypothetical protein